MKMKADSDTRPDESDDLATDSADSVEPMRRTREANSEGQI